MENKAIVKKSAIEAMAGRLLVTPANLKATLLATAFKDCKTDAEFISAVIVANTYQLNPLLGEIYAFPGKKGGVCPIVPIDGWIKLMNTHKGPDNQPDHDGCTIVENRDKDGKVNISKTDVISITATIYTKGRTYPTVVTEYMAECFDGSKGPWIKWPVRMLRHKALIQCARVAYGFSGIYEPDEGERIVASESMGTPIDMPVPKRATATVTPAGNGIAEPVPGRDITEEEKAEIQRKEAENA